MNGFTAATTTTTRPKLDPDRDLAIIACERAVSDARCIGVRWAARPDLGFPPSGFLVGRRFVNDVENITEIGATFFLPDTTNWAAFAADVAGRRPARGPWFPNIARAEMEFLLPLIRYVDPRVAVGDRVAQVQAVANFFGNIHRSDPELAWHIWRHNEPPPLADLLADTNNAPLVLQFYLQHSMNFLMVLALRFEYAVLLGLGTDDLAPDGELIYEVYARWQDFGGSSFSDPVPTNQRCAPSAPAWLHAERAPGTVPHPAFAAWPNWEPPLALAPQEASGAPRPASTLVPRVPAAFTALTWADKAPEPRLIGHGPVLYEVSRYDHGAGSAASLATPTLPVNAVFTRLGDGALYARTQTEPHLLDRPGMPWPPLEGHYHYEVRGVDLLGVTSTGAARASVRHHDDIAPPAPRAAIESVLALPPGATQAQVPIRIDWDPVEDFNGPDVREFRVAARWIPTTAIPVHINEVADTDPIHCDLTVDNLPSPADAFAGLRLTVPGSEYQIVSHGTGSPASMRIRKIGTRKPAPGSDGVIFAAGKRTRRIRVGRLPRRAAAPATVETVSSLTPLTFSLSPSAGVPLPTDNTARLYLHLLRATFDATYEPATQRWRVTEPPIDTPARAVWERWLALPNRTAVITGSPIIVYPPHDVTVNVALPPGFSAGLLVLLVSAADGASYVESKVLPVADSALAGARGNESGSFEIILSVRSTDPPAPPVTPAWDPNVRSWARSATVYVENAEYDLTWPAVPSAVRYEVWRALEGAIPEATVATSDADLRSLAAPSATAFELRSDQIFAPRFTDPIPGRAPTRVLYRLRTIGLNGVPSAPSDLIGPVYVPDVRQPPPPNLVRAVATKPEEADRTIAVEWTQSADTNDVRFDVYFRLGIDAATPASASPFTLAGSVPRGTPPGAGGAFRFLHGERPPGKPFEYYVVAVREALDPFDPAATLRRDIAGPASARRTGKAISSTPLGAPTSLAAAYDATNNLVVLNWTVSDFYDRIEVQRKGPGRFAFENAGSAAGDALEFKEAAPGSGTWSYRLRAFGGPLMSLSDVEVEVVIP